MTVTSGASSNNGQWQAYLGLAATYNRHRPGYPESALQAIADRTRNFAADSHALDVGCGTGIFTRCLAQHVLFRVTGVEPNDDMRSQATVSSSQFRRVAFAAGTAEALPRPSGNVVLVTAATAAHWFDRARFYSEVADVLQAGGVLALVQNKRRYWDSELLAAYEGIHEKHVPEYGRGTFADHAGGYSEADFAAELRRQPRFENCKKLTWEWNEVLTRRGFLSFSLSSSITQKAIVRSGRDEVMGEVAALLDRLAGPDGEVAMPYVTELTVAIRR